MRLLLALAALLVAAAPVVAAVDPLAETRIAAGSGDANAQFALAEALRTGKGAPADREAAIMWYKRAAALGHADASDTVGFLLFAAGQRSEAMPYIEKAAARGDPRAFYLLGTAHFNGDYVARDWPLAYAQMMRAAEAGVMPARKSLIVMDKYLLPGDKAKAETILTTLPPIRRLSPAATRLSTALANEPPPSSHTATPVASSPTARTIAPVTSGASTEPSAPRAAPPPAASPQPAAGGAWRVQLGAYASADRARGDWDRLVRKVPALRQFDQRVVQASPGVQRLQAGGLADRRAAESLCRQIHAAGGACFALAP
ncbi:SPOR domain-containing protein [Sphingomonas nostoxanthinifaciens]|uniref:SPOR domain-containing protein n=1 Tax=Sphingomonas nostoxanthinifaciens TaxID=2872652 RepID=UPI001CC21846|nr:SPOR domain-containing protein [Sphingomonas nostoxanthinifaciens]UAK24849.1 SPOR domain-containing protein [Sphingomonas nostoxanthinifaciens]